MTAAAGATGARSWLQAHHISPRALRATTIALFVAAFGISSVGLSGSTPAHAKPAAHAQPAAPSATP